MLSNWLPASERDPEACELLTQSICRAADLSRPPHRHAFVPSEQLGDSWIGRLEVRDGDGQRQPALDLELEIYGAAADPSLQLSWCDDDSRPLLWQGRHPVWMDGTSGQSCARPSDGVPLETLARRLRAELVQG